MCCVINIIQPDFKVSIPVTTFEGLTRAGKSRDYCDVIVFGKLRFKMFSVYT